MTFIITALTVIISILAFNSGAVMDRLIFNPYHVQREKQWYRFISCGFIHADWIHLLVNMLVLYSFGTQVEVQYEDLFENKATYYYLLLYFGGIVISILPTYVNHKDNPGYNALGASGGVSSIVFAYILFNPVEKIYLYGFIGLPGILMGVGYLIYSYYMSQKGRDNVNHNAHFWGAMYGIIYTLALKPSLFTHFLNQLSNFRL